MLLTLAKYISKFSICRRLLYICQHLPLGLPKYWEHVSKFVNLNSTNEESITGEGCQLCFDNMTSLDCAVLQSEDAMFKELCDYTNSNNLPLGYVLISRNNKCRVCGHQLRVKSRGKEVAKVVVYDEINGTFMASHYTKFCSGENCRFRQFYGKYTLTGSDIHFDPDWSDYKYFLSTTETAFDIALLERLLVSRCTKVGI